LEARGKHLPLPPLVADTANPVGPVGLARIPAPNKELELELRGCNSVFDQGADVSLKPDPSSETPGWTVFARAINAVSQAPQPIAHFGLSGETLRFHWDGHASSDLHPALLRFCILRIKSKDQSIDCSLFQPDPLDPLAPNVKARRFIWNFTNSKAGYPNPQKLRFEAIVKGLPGKDAPVVKNVSVGEAASFAMSESDSGEPLLNLRLKILQKDDALSLQGEYFSQEGPPELGKHKPSKANSRKPMASEHPCSLTDVKAWLKTAQRKTANTAAPQDGDPGPPQRGFGSTSRRTKTRRITSRSSRFGSAGIEEHSDTEASLTKLQSLLEQISQNTRIGLRVYIEIDGQPVDLLVSRFD
jgi:hypothetical protein